MQRSHSIESQAKKHAEFSKPKTPFSNIAFRAGNIPAAEYFKFQAFTTAVVQDEDIRNRIKTELEKNLREGLSQRAFYKALESTFKAAGLGEPKKLLQNVYATTTALAYGAGQQAKMIELKDTFPYWQYSAVMDSRTRPSHKALHGKIFKADDQYFHPPLGFRCRCTAIPLTARQAGKLPPEDFVQPAQHEAIKSELSNAEFIGNKQANYLRWVEQKYVTASPEAKELIRKAASELDNTLMTSLVPISPKMIETAVGLVRKGYEVIRSRFFPKSPTKEALALNRETIREFAKDNIVSIPFKTSDGKTIVMSNRDVKDVLNKPHNKIIEKNNLLYDLENVLKSAKLVGSAGETKKRPKYKQWYYYEYQRRFYLNVVKKEDGKYTLHGIGDRLIKKGLEKHPTPDIQSGGDSHPRPF